MGLKNFLMLLTGVPFIYGAALSIILYERAHSWMTPIQNELIYQLGLSRAPDKYPIMILLISTAFCYLQFFLSTYVAAINRKEDWDNTNTRDVEERKTGLSCRANHAHLNEGEQFRYISVAVIISLILMNNISDTKDAKLSMDFINYCCTGYIVHRFIFHLMFILNIDILRSLMFAVSFIYSIILFSSSIYGVTVTSNNLNGMTPPQFKELDIAKMIAGFTEK